MKLYVAIDIREGRAVRLLRGEKGSETVYGDDPVLMATAWVERGARHLHVVDLDAAFGERSNRQIIERLIASVPVPVQVGGGVRRMSEFSRWLEAGASTVVVGTAAVEDPELLDQTLSLAPTRVVIAVDVRAGRVATRGWEQASSAEPVEFACRWADRGARQFLYTDISRDGALGGPNVSAIRQFAQKTGAEVIASGGVAQLSHLEELSRCDRYGVKGTIVGKALYEKRFTVESARAVLGDEG